MCHVLNYSSCDRKSQDPHTHCVPLVAVSVATGAAAVLGHPPCPCSVPSHSVVQGGMDSDTDVLSTAWDPPDGA